MAQYVPDPPSAEPTLGDSPLPGGTRGGRVSGEVPPRIAILHEDVALAGRVAAYLAENEVEAAILPSLDAAEGGSGRPFTLLLLGRSWLVARPTDFLRTLRARIGAPIIVLANASDEIDRVVNLELGADDQVADSLPLRELLARIRAVQRRMPATRPPAPPAAEPAEPGRARRGWVIAAQRRDVIDPEGRPVGLSTAEFDLLQVLIDADGKALDRDELTRRVFGRPWRPFDRAADIVVHKLRRKLPPDSIVTVRSRGYTFAGFPPASVG
jgi:DNA-binding response OmpR family regulator